MPIRGLENYSKATLPSHFDIEKIIRPNILALLPYRCARDDYQSGILLDANENALGHSIDLQKITESLDSFVGLDLHRYPDPAQIEIKERIAALRDIPGPDHVFLGVGSDEVIDLLIRICCVPSVDKILTTPPTYGMYAVCGQVNDVPLVKIPLITEKGAFQLDIDGIKRAVTADPSIKLIFVCSPGNPTGTLIPLPDIRQLLEYPDFKGIVVVDEAYIDFAGSDASAVQLVKEYANICIMQTLSKSFGLAAIRLGIAIAQPPLIQILTNTKAPYNISTPTAVLALEALSPSSLTAMRAKVSSLIKARSQLISKLAPLSQLGLGNSIGGNHANFLLVPILDKERQRPDDARAKQVYKEMAEKRAIVVRYRGDQLGCDACLRITVGSAEENQALLEQLEDVLRTI
ncbi:histidinol-phosphate aminotransferase [Hysterangium stoloniferum]|nr:histidinol-phosphate aminotransferase [Hysterangium stoloniferum]